MPTPRLTPAVLFTTLLALTAAANAAPVVSPPALHPVPRSESADFWFRMGRSAVDAARGRAPNTGRAKNIILFVGDGMGITTITAARILGGQLEGTSGEENSLSFERFPWAGLAKTYSTNLQTPESAGTMTAIATGVKTQAGFISVDQSATRNDHLGVDGARLPTILEIFESLGRSTGVISTSRITHATPAACYAHTPERSWEDDRAMARYNRAALDEGFKDIALQLMEFPIGDGLEVALGGGRDSFRPMGAPDPEDPASIGARLDGRDLVREWDERGTDWATAWNTQQFEAVDPARTNHLLGLFEIGHMTYEHERLEDRGGEPSLSEMVETGLSILMKNPDGFFLMAEAGRIDHGHHECRAYRALTETLEFDRAVSTAVRVLADAGGLEETLIIVTADHSHVFTMAGYPTRGNPITGKVLNNDGSGRPRTAFAPDAHGLPYTTLGYANGRGFRPPGDSAGAHRPDLTDVDTGAPKFRQEATVPLGSETHSGEDVPVYGRGPWAHLLARPMEQHELFHVMLEALQLPDAAIDGALDAVRTQIESPDQ